MKSFKGYLTEFAVYSTSDYVFTLADHIPISGPMLKRIWPDTIRTIVFHVLSAEDIYALKKLEGGKKTISAFFSMMSRYMESGIATGGGIVAEMEADVIVSAKDDIMSKVDNRGRRWVELSWFQNANITGPGFNKVEKDLNTLIKKLVIKHLPKYVTIHGQEFQTKSQHEYELWTDMKKHLKGDGKKISLVIKDYFDGVEKVIKKNSKVMGNILLGYAKGKRMTDNAWDEQIVNNIDIKKVHLITFTQTPNEKEVEIIEYIDSQNWPLTKWDASINLEIYTRQVVAKEIGRTIK
jgi:hypothetical protein